MSLSRRVADRIMGTELYEQFVFRKRVLFQSDEAYVRRRFREVHGYEPDLEHPRTYCEKITWLMLYYRPLQMASLADKYEVRSHVQNRIGEEYLNQLYGVYTSTSDIPWEALPDAFAFKATHGCHWNILCPDRSKLDRQKSIRTMRRWLRLNYYWFGREWVYRSLKPRIICERYLFDDNGTDLTDYKVHCFNGRARLIQVDMNRHGEHRMGFLSPDWDLLPVGKSVPRLHGVPRRPASLTQMLALSEELAEKQPLVRIDWYEHEENPLFGEMTFLPGRGLSAFDEEEHEAEFGSWIELPSPHRKNEVRMRIKSALRTKWS